VLSRIEESTNPKARPSREACEEVQSLLVCQSHLEGLAEFCSSFVCFRILEERLG